MATLLLTKLVLSFCFLLLAGFISPGNNKQQPDDTQLPAARQTNRQNNQMEGAWQLKSSTGESDATRDGNTAVRIMADGFFSVAYYNKENKQFSGTYGGTYTVSNGKLIENYEFDTFDTSRVGTSATLTHTFANDRWQVKRPGSTETWEKIKDGTRSPLAGAWRITGRLRDGLMSPMQQGPRKTIKMLSGNRFQWIAFNSETAVFSGTGGGTYTFQDGKYTETIDFFSRDSSRVGRELTFDYEVKDGNWHHSGLSSTGGSVNEVWQRLSKQ